MNQKLNLDQYLNKNPPDFDGIIRAIKPFGLYRAERHLVRARRMWCIDEETATAFAKIAMHHIFKYCNGHGIIVE